MSKALGDSLEVLARFKEKGRAGMPEILQRDLRNSRFLEDRLEGVPCASEVCGSPDAVREDQVVPLVLRSCGQYLFIRPISDLSLRVAPDLQGTATYTLSAFAASGDLLATTSITVTQDLNDPANTGFGYFTIGLTNLPHPAKSFTFESEFVRSSSPLTKEIGYGISSIAYVRWGGPR